MLLAIMDIFLDLENNTKKNNVTAMPHLQIRLRQQWASKPGYLSWFAELFLLG